MFAVIAAILQGVCGAFIAVRKKRLRNHDVDTAAVLAILGFSLPLWYAIIAYHLIAGWQPSILYVGVVGLWVAICCLLNLLVVFLKRYQGLMESRGYLVTFKLFLAILIDFFVFGTAFSSTMLLAACLAMIGPFLLFDERVTVVQDSRRRFSLPVLIAGNGIIAVLGMSILALFKYALTLQDNVVLHAAISQAGLFTIFVMIGGKRLYYALQATPRRINRQTILEMAGLICVAALCEGLALRDLPLYIYIITGAVTSLILVSADIENGEIRLNRRSVVASFLIIAGGGLPYVMA